MGWTEEFPDYPAADLPHIPEGWIDSSWHNDACPSFTFLSAADNGADSNFQIARVWIDWVDTAAREFPGGRRFVVTFDGGERNDVDAFQSDSWAETLAYVLPRVELSKAYRAAIGHCPFLDCPEIEPDSVNAVLMQAKESDQ